MKGAFNSLCPLQLVKISKSARWGNGNLANLRSKVRGLLNKVPNDTEPGRVTAKGQLSTTRRPGKPKGTSIKQNAVLLLLEPFGRKKSKISARGV